ncbi:phosphoglycerol transferase MdoB-like AlkP superfamily enzyme [Dysgonomonas alginatilytica]|uniref:Phosphoglycerol transferase MdoB-like AlkP superfamily enzyme n=1 Tax=Dysgonomonas alginatilytica TaxID=1605892 RepID=A0A2V3PML3_9BACT|nr:LTA synthase family protein [Dysgonomonas alginatilytica]PXV63380.1 phosphoglycerol transferase MdoB-like AlkP superfamily enzyme [Dysgonomonas alginatilytica]
MKKLQFLKPLLNFVFIALLITTVSRVILFFMYKDRVDIVENYWEIFPIGLRIDLILISYLSFIPAILLFFLPDKLAKYTSRFLTIYFVLFLFLIFFMEIVSPDFIDQYDTRPNKLFLEYLIYPKEVATMLLKGRVVTVIIVLLLSGAALWFGFKKGAKLFIVRPTEYKYRLLLFPLAGFLLFWGARGSLTSKRPINPSLATFSNDQLTNCLALNSTYTLFYAAYGLKNEVDASKMYGKMDLEEAIACVKKYMNVDEGDFTNPDLPLMHTQMPDTLLSRPYNLVIFLQESLGAEFVGALGGMPLTPELDRLSKEGLLFSRLYSTGTRSVRGIEAVATGFLPSPSESVVKLSGAQTDFFTLGALLKQAGYNTSFIYGGMANFDNMGSFFNGNGFDNIIDESVLDKDDTKYAFKGTWGYSDEDLVTKANEYFKSLGDKPFFSFMFSSSNHDPFEFPDGRIELYEQPKNTVHNAIKYADFSIGKFFELAKKEDYFKNTVFIVIADHNTRTYGKNLVPINKFRIPALIIGPNVPQDVKYDKLSSQIDIPPTLLSMIGMKVETPMPGRNIIQLADSIPGRAIMQFHDINAFRVEDRVVIMQPNKKPLQFEVRNDTTLVPMELDTELAKDALGHVIAADYMYKEKKYRLK